MSSSRSIQQGIERGLGRANPPPNQGSIQQGIESLTNLSISPISFLGEVSSKELRGNSLAILTPQTQRSKYPARNWENHTCKLPDALIVKKYPARNWEYELVVAPSDEARLEVSRKELRAAVSMTKSGGAIYWKYPGRNWEIMSIRQFSLFSGCFSYWCGLGWIGGMD